MPLKSTSKSAQAKRKISGRRRNATPRAEARRLALRDREHRLNLQSMCEHFDELHADLHGKYALMRHGKIIAIHDQAGDVLEDGLAKYPDMVFSIQPITNTPIAVSRLLDVAI